MFRSRLIGVIVGTSLAFNGLILDSASAQTENLSDNTGTNVSNDPGPSIPGGISADIIEGAQQLANQLNRRQRFSNRRCNPPKRCNLRRFAIGRSSDEQTVIKPRLRTFAIGKKDPNRSCPIPKQLSVCSNSTDLDALLNKSKTFLYRVNQGVEARRAKINNRLW